MFKLITQANRPVCLQGILPSPIMPMLVPGYSVHSKWLTFLDILPRRMLHIIVQDMPKIEAILNKITPCIARASSLGHHLRTTHHSITGNHRPEEFRKGLPITTKGGPLADNTRRISSMETEARPRAEMGQTCHIIRGGHPVKQIRATRLITAMLVCLHGLTTPMLTVLSIRHSFIPLGLVISNLLHTHHQEKHIILIISKHLHDLDSASPHREA